MNSKKYNWIFYLISITTITTLAVQFYWNYKNYQLNKQRVHNEIRESFENAIDYYITKSDISIYINNFRKNENPKSQYVKNMDSLFIFLPLSKQTHKLSENLYILDTLPKKIRQIKNQFINDSIIQKSYSDILSIKHIESQNFDSIKCQQKCITSTKDDSYFDSKLGITIDIMDKRILDIHEIDSILKKSLERKKINTTYSFEYSVKDKKIIPFKNISYNDFKILKSDSPRLPLKNELKLKYENPNIEILKRSFTGLSLSFLLSLTIISSLFYLLKIINDQKELAAIKNDLISNITHEFKTPITTVTTALEAINSFDAIKDTEKTKKYISISENQIKKLHLMVEKLLETASLDSEKLLLNKEAIDIVDLLDRLSKKHQLFTNDKMVKFSSNSGKVIVNADEFHLENAISNLIDNAIKYGGDMIQVNLNVILNSVEISIIDNGNGIEKSQQEKIFDKFYRVPKGNIHDVKGFGIGLYYTKKIVEKHNGTISLTSNNKQTNFKISLPNE